MAEKNSVQRSQSRYVSGGDTEVNAKALEWWERTIIPTANDDRIYVVQSHFAGRLDNIAHAFLNDRSKWWVIAQLNNILDPFSEVTEGRVLYIPTVSRLHTILNGQTGGKQSQRTVPTNIISPIV